MKLFLILSLLLFTLVFTAHAGATVYHVDVNNGDDDSSGSEERPFKTINHVSGILEPGDKAIIHEGIYHEQIIGGKSGLPGKPITYEGVNRDKVILRGSVTARDWKKSGFLWFKAGLKPITKRNVFVMVDEKRMLKKESSLQDLPEGSFCLDNNNYFIRLWGDADPNINHVVDVYELDLGFNAGARWGGTNKNFIILRNMTLEKYGSYGIAGSRPDHAVNTNWELDNLRVQFNYQGVFCALDGWYIHNCIFSRNVSHGIQIDGSGVRFVNNSSNQNGWFGHSIYAECGMLIGPDEWANSCEIRGNLFKDNGYAEGYGCGIYLEGRSRNNVVENNFIEGSTHAGIGFYGSSFNRVVNNVLIDIAPKNFWRLTAAFVIHHSLEGAPTQSVGNLIAFNTVYRCSAPVAVTDPSQPVKKDELNRFVDNLFYVCRHMLTGPNVKVAVFDNNAWFECPEAGSQASSNLKESVKAFFDKIPARGIDALDTHPIRGIDPMLKNVSKNDFVPMPGSPLVGAGIKVDSLTKDMKGILRNQRGRPDIGAFESPTDEKRGDNVDESH
jgi:parallel beta-helix repeat protein